MHIIKKHIKALIFDLDGTIVHTNNHWQEATRNVLAKHGHTTLTPEQEKMLRSIGGTSLKVAVGMVKEAFNLPESIDDLSAEKQRIVQARLTKESTSFVDGFTTFHQEISAHNISSGIATNADTNSLRHLCQAFELPHFFGEHIYSFADVNNRPKPDPALFLHTAERLGYEPSECIVFEDSLQGFLAAQAAGMKCIAIKHDDNHDHLHKTHAHITSYSQALEALRSLI